MSNQDVLTAIADPDYQTELGANNMSFTAAQRNFLETARHGMQANLYWPGLGNVTTAEFVLAKLLPMADEGLKRWGVATEVRDRFLGVIEGRARTGRNGAA
jgi:hypothetical protein